MIAYSGWAETEAFMDGYVWGYRKGCLGGYEKCLKVLENAGTPEKLRAMLKTEIAQLCQEIEDDKNRRQ